MTLPPLPHISVCRAASTSQPHHQQSDPGPDARHRPAGAWSRRIRCRQNTPW